MGGILWVIVAVVVVVWLLGLIFEVAGNFIHLLLIIAAVMIVLNLLRGRRAV